MKLVITLISALILNVTLIAQNFSENFDGLSSISSLNEIGYVLNNGSVSNGNSISGLGFRTNPLKLNETSSLTTGWMNFGIKRDTIRFQYKNNSKQDKSEVCLVLVSENGKRDTLLKPISHNGNNIISYTAINTSVVGFAKICILVKGKNLTSSGVSMIDNMSSNIATTLNGKTGYLHDLSTYISINKTVFNPSEKAAFTFTIKNNGPDNLVYSATSYLVNLPENFIVDSIRYSSANAGKNFTSSILTDKTFKVTSLKSGDSINIIAFTTAPNTSSSVEVSMGLKNAIHSIDPRVDNNSFRAEIKVVGVLPVTWAYMTVKRIEGVDVIKWATASETNNSHFVVEMSLNGISWNTIETVSGQGTSNDFNYYSFNNTRPFNTVYYRVMQVDLDGAHTYSEVRRVETAELSADVKAYPVPSSESVTISWNIENQFDVQIVNMNGQIIKMINQINESTTVNIMDLPNGIYFIRATSNDQIKTMRIVKN